MTDKFESWQMTSAIGKLVLPTMNLLSQKLPRMDGATLCTADGFNVCSIGLDSQDVGKMSSLSSSMFALTGSIIESVTNKEDSADKKEVFISTGDTQIVLVQVSHPKLDSLVLLVSVTDTSTGVILMAVRFVVAELEKQFQQ